MSRSVAIIAAVAAIAGIGAIVGVGLTRGGASPSVPSPSGDPVELTTAVGPSPALAGDRLVADLTLKVDTTRVDPGAIEVGAFFRPFRQVGRTGVEQIDRGATTIIHYRYPLQCIDRACALGEAPERTIDLPVGLVRYTPLEGDVVSLPLTWPGVTFSTRLSAEQRADIGSRPLALSAAQGDQVPPLVPVGRATAIGWTLLGVSATILLAVALLIALSLRSLRARVSVEPESPRGPSLASALVALDEAGDDEGRRVALDALALRLGEAGEDGLARDARRLAWSRSGPAEAEVAALRDALTRLREVAA